jgi:hypothetical protein
MLTMLLLLATPAEAGKWDDAPSDVEVRTTIAASPEQVHRTLADLEVLAELLPPDCAKDWEFTANTRGVGSRARVTYTYGPLKRTLTAQVVNDEPGRLWRIDHADDKKGFFIQVTYPTTPNPGVSSVVLSTPLNPPPWPLKGAFFKKVRPAWEDCYTRALEGLAAKVSAP